MLIFWVFCNQYQHIFLDEMSLREIDRCQKENDRRRGNGMRKQCLRNTDSPFFKSILAEINFIIYSWRHPEKKPLTISVAIPG